MSGAITVRLDERQAYATYGGKEAIDAWIAIRGDWAGTLLCPVAKGGLMRPREMTAQAVMVRVRTIRRAVGRRAGYAERSTLYVLDRAGAAATRLPDEGQARRVTGTRDAVRSVPIALNRRSSRRGLGGGGFGIRRHRARAGDSNYPEFRHYFIPLIH